MMYEPHRVSIKIQYYKKLLAGIERITPSSWHTMTFSLFFALASSISLSAISSPRTIVSIDCWYSLFDMVFKNLIFLWICNCYGLRKSSRYLISIDKFAALQNLGQYRIRRCCFTCTVATTNNIEILFLHSNFLIRKLCAKVYQNSNLSKHFWFFFWKKKVDGMRNVNDNRKLSTISEKRQSTTSGIFKKPRGASNLWNPWSEK